VVEVVRHRPTKRAMRPTARCTDSRPSILAGPYLQGRSRSAEASSPASSVNSAAGNDEIHEPMGGVRDSGWGSTGPASLKEFQTSSGSTRTQRPAPIRRSERSPAMKRELSYRASLAAAGSLHAAQSPGKPGYWPTPAHESGLLRLYRRRCWSRRSVIAGECRRPVPEVLVVESGALDRAPTISNPSLGLQSADPLDWSLPSRRRRSHNRQFKMAWATSSAAGARSNAMVWARGMALGIRQLGAKMAQRVGRSRDVLPMVKAQEALRGRANEWRGAGGPRPIRSSWRFSPDRA